MGLKGEALVEDGAEVEKFWDLGDGEGRGVRREVTGEDPRVCCTTTTLGGGFVEDDDFGLERGDCQTVTVTGGLGRMEETLHGRSCVGDETKVVDVQKDSEEGHGVRVRESQVGMVTLDGVDEVGDVESPKEGRKTTTFRQAFEDVDVGSVVGESVEDTVHEGVMECTDALPEVRWDMVIMESNEELVAGDGRESKFDITEEDDGGVVVVGAFMLVGDV
jgi:hypothetical protein